MNAADGADAGVAAVGFVYDCMQIDPEWSIRGRRDFTWWGRDLPQHVRADGPVVDRGLYVSRLTAVTPIVRNVTGSAREVCKGLAVVNALGAILSGFVFDEGARQVSLACSTKVYHDPDSARRNAYFEAMSRAFGLAVTAQAAQAHAVAGSLARMFGGTVAASSHPWSGVRNAPDEMLGTLAWFEQRGDDSVWAGEQMAFALKTFRKAGLLAVGGDAAVSAEIPFHGQTALVVFDTRQTHPNVGRGLSVRLSLPEAANAESAAATAAMLNRAEMNANDRSFATYMGGWCVSPDGLVTFVAFYPNVFVARGFAITIAEEMMLRVRWLTRSMFQEPRRPSKWGMARSVSSSAAAAGEAASTRTRERAPGQKRWGLPPRTAVPASR